jgi:hypothetical protein
VSARTNASKINRSIQLKVNVVHNEEGPLMRTTHASSENEVAKGNPAAERNYGLIKRVEDLEEYFSIKLDRKKGSFAFAHRH